MISHIQTNFSHLTDTSKCNCLKMLEKSSEHLQNNACDLFGKSMKIFLHLRLSLEVVGKSSALFGRLKKFQRSSEVFQKLRQSLEAVGKSLEIQVLWRCKLNLMHFTEKKLAVIFGSCCEIFGNLQKWLEIFGDLWKSSEIFGNLPKPSVKLSSEIHVLWR